MINKKRIAEIEAELEYLEKEKKEIIKNIVELIDEKTDLENE